MRNRWLIAFALAGLVACILAPPVLAKFRMSMTLGNPSPRVGQRIVIVRTDRAVP